MQNCRHGDHMAKENLLKICHPDFKLISSTLPIIVLSQPKGELLLLYAYINKLNSVMQ